MRQIRETLRLHLQAGLSYNEVGRALKISKSVVGKYVSLARVAGVDWERAHSLSDEELERLIPMLAERSFRPRQVLFQAGDPPERVRKLACRVAGSEERPRLVGKTLDEEQRLGRVHAVPHRLGSARLESTPI